MEFNQFKKCWKALLVNYGENNSTSYKEKLLFNRLKKFDYEDVSRAIANVIDNNRYFPNVNEIIHYILENKNSTIHNQNWMKHSELCTITPPTVEEVEEMDLILNEIMKDQKFNRRDELKR